MGLHTCPRKLRPALRGPSRFFVALERSMGHEIDPERDKRLNDMAGQGPAIDLDLVGTEDLVKALLGRGQAVVVLMGRPTKTGSDNEVLRRVIGSRYEVKGLVHDLLDLLRNIDLTKTVLEDDDDGD